jgi:hypothetical protein
MARDDLTDHASEGFHAAEGAKCPYFDSSPASSAWHVGLWMQTTGRPAPRDVRMGRGYSVHVNDMLVDASDTTKIERLK